MTSPVATWQTWRRYAHWAADVGATWRAERAAIARLPKGDMSGECSVCGGQVEFSGDPAADSTREGLACTVCGSSARQRAVAMVLFDGLERPWQSAVYMTEHASSFYVRLRRLIGRLHGSEYGLGLRRRLRMSTWLWRSGVLEFVRLEDVTALSHRDTAMDAVVCQDVLEHVPDYRAALREMARVLKPGGRLVLTVPFYDATPDSVQVAHREADGRIECVGDPEYHGDPVSGGVLCYHHFGWDLLDAMRDAGFADADACRVRDIDRGLPQGLWVLRATR